MSRRNITINQPVWAKYGLADMAQHWRSASVEAIDRFEKVTQLTEGGNSGDLFPLNGNWPTVRS